MFTLKILTFHEVLCTKFLPCEIERIVMALVLPTIRGPIRLSLFKFSSLWPSSIAPRSRVTRALVTRRRERSRAVYNFCKWSRPLLLLVVLLLFLLDSLFDRDSSTRSCESIIASTDQHIFFLGCLHAISQTHLVRNETDLLTPFQPPSPFALLPLLSLPFLVLR